MLNANNKVIYRLSPFNALKRIVGYKRKLTNQQQEVMSPIAFNIFLSVFVFNTSV